VKHDYPGSRRLRQPRPPRLSRPHRRPLLGRRDRAGDGHASRSSGRDRRHDYRQLRHAPVHPGRRLLRRRFRPLI
jgi:hypothetical protein